MAARRAWSSSVGQNMSMYFIVVELPSLARRMAPRHAGHVALQKCGLGPQTEQESTDVFVMIAPRLELVGDGVHVAEASLERAVLENRVRAGQCVGGVDHA